MREQKSNQFWQARLAQAFLIFIGIITILPVIWGLCAGFMIKLVYPLSISISAILSAGLYMPAFITAIFIGLVIGVRSATWGEVTGLFMFITVMLLSIIMYVLIHFFHIFGFGKEHFWLWIICWLISAIIGYGLLRFSALDKRYKSSQRPLLLKSLYIVVIYSLYVPAFYIIFRLSIVEDTQYLAYLAGRYELSTIIEPVSFLIAIIIAFGFVVMLRRGKYSIYYFFLWPFAVMVCFLILQIIADEFENIALWVWFYSIITVLSIGFCSVLLILLNLGHETSLGLFDKSSNKLKFAFIVFVILSLVSIPLWQSLTIIWRSTLFGLPPANFFIEQIHTAVICGALFFALPCALYVLIKQNINFGIMFIIALFASFASSFLPSGHLGISLGFLFNHLFWPILIFGPIVVLGWYILSRLPQIKCKLYEK